MTSPGRRTQPDDEHDPRLLARIVSEQARPYVGWAFIVAGALLVLLGYLGVSRESLVAKQLPFVVSGGIGGVLLTVIGAYFLGTEELRKDGGRLDRMERQLAELHAALLSRADAPQLDDASVNGRDPSSALVVAVAAGETFHRANCMLTAGKERDELTPVEAEERGLRPCPVCEPVPAS